MSVDLRALLTSQAARQKALARRQARAYTQAITAAAASLNIARYRVFFFGCRPATHVG